MVVAESLKRLGVTGFEPAAPRSRTVCSTRLSYTPMFGVAAREAPLRGESFARQNSKHLGPRSTPPLRDSLSDSAGRPWEGGRVCTKIQWVTSVREGLDKTHLAVKLKEKLANHS